MLGNTVVKIKNKYNGMSKSVKAALWFTGCYVIQRGIQFFMMPILTRIMTKEDYGSYSVFLSWFNIINIFTSMNIYSGTFNKAMIRYENQREQYMSCVQGLTSVIALAAGILIFVFRSAISKITGFSNLVLLLMVIHLFFFPTLQYWCQEQRFKYEYRKMVFITVLQSLLNLVCGVAAVLICSGSQADALIAAIVAVQAFICFFLYISIYRKGKAFYNKAYWKWSLGLAVPLIPHYLSEVLLGHSDRIMINQMCGFAQAGIYNIVYQISMVMTILRTGINGAFIPWLYYAIKGGQQSKIRKVTGSLAIMMAAMSIFFMSIGPEIFKVAAPSSYYEAVIDIPAIMAGCFYIFVYVLFMNVEIYYEKKNYVAIASAIAAAVNIILNYFCIGKFGYLAAGYTTMISYGLMIALHFAFLLRISKEQPQILKYFDFKLLIGLSAIVAVVVIIMLFLYEHIILRFICIAALFTLIAFNWRKIYRLFKEFRNKD